MMVIAFILVWIMLGWALSMFLAREKETYWGKVQLIIIAISWPIVFMVVLSCLITYFTISFLVRVCRYVAKVINL